MTTKKGPFFDFSTCLTNSAFVIIYMQLLWDNSHTSDTDDDCLIIFASIFFLFIRFILYFLCCQNGKWDFVDCCLYVCKEIVLFWEISCQTGRVSWWVILFKPTIVYKEIRLLSHETHQFLSWFIFQIEKTEKNTITEIDMTWLV